MFSSTLYAIYSIYIYTGLVNTRHQLKQIWIIDLPQAASCKLQAIKIMKEEVCEKLADLARKVETLLILIQEDEEGEG